MINNIKYSQTISFSTFHSDYVPESGGVYLLLGPMKLNGDHQVLYVGKSINLRQRFLQHLKSDDKRIRNHVTNYVYSLESSELLQTSKEVQLIAYFNPPINTQYKSLINDVIKKLEPATPKLSDLLVRKPLLGKIEQNLSKKKEIQPLGLGLLKKEPTKFPMSILKNKNPL